MSVIARLKAAGFEAYTRAEWGTARPAAYARRLTTHPMPSGPARYHFLHITVTADTDTKLEGFAGMRKVESYGLSTPPMVSYQMVVTNEGRAFEGQSYDAKGTHTVNDKDVQGFPHDLNRYGHACAIMQNVGDEVTAAQARLVAAVFAAAELEGHVAKGAPIYPHRKFANKDCPGDKAVAWLPWIAAKKDHLVATGMRPANEGSGDVDWSSKVPNTDVSLGTTATRALWLYDQSTEGGALDRRDDAQQDQIDQLRRDLQAALNRIQSLENGS